MTDCTVEKIKKQGNLPRHIAIIMDGNGRWAKKRRLPRIAGHREGVKSVREIVEICGELGIEVVTLYTFSTENWSRPAKEVSALMKLLLRTIQNEIDDLMANNVRLKAIGGIDHLPDGARKGILNGIEKTRDNTGLILNLALNYGGREEILTAIRLLAEDVKNGIVKPDLIDKEHFQKYLFTVGLPDPDLLIRTSGELRISNFLLWQLAYTEIFVTEVLWPDFRKKELLEAIENYQSRERRFGKVSEQLIGTRK
jgi:undecaprenyl diphosphate synthase